MRTLLRILAGALILWFSAQAPAQATITSTSTKVTAACNSVTTLFNFSFVGVSSADIVVTVTTSAGVPTVLTSGTQYTLTLNAPPANAIWGLGGSVLYPLTGPACPTGSTITIARSVPYTQTTPFANQGPFLPQATESAVDLLTMQAQQLNTLFGGALVQPSSDTQAFSALPAAAARANLALCFDSTGYVPTACSVPASGTISSAMQPVVSAGSLAAGRTAFGLGTAAVESIGSYGMQDDGAGNLRQSFISSQVATNQSIVGANHLTQYACTGPITFNLARGNTLWNGFGIWINAVSGTCTLTPNANDSIILSTGTLGSGVSLALAQGQQIFVYTDGATFANWYVRYAGYANQAKQATQTPLTSGSGTYTTPAGCLQVRVRMVGGGGGGGGSGATAGGATSFAGWGGNGGSNGVTQNGGVGGSGGSTGGTGTLVLRLAGGTGQSGFSTGNASSITVNSVGAGTAFGASGVAGVTNTGAGGSANGTIVNGSGFSPGGGGGGEYVEFVINNPAATYAYSVGAAGTAGSGSQPGGSGVIIVEERY